MSESDRIVSGLGALWLGLVSQKGMADRPKLLDVAMRSRGAVGCLAGIQRSFEDADRDGDASVTRALRALIEAGEIAVVTSMRAEWLGLRSLVHSRSDQGL